MVDNGHGYAGMGPHLEIYKKDQVSFYVILFKIMTEIINNIIHRSGSGWW